MFSCLYICPSIRRSTSHIKWQLFLRKEFHLIDVEGMSKREAPLEYHSNSCCRQDPSMNFKISVTSLRRKGIFAYPPSIPPSSRYLFVVKGRIVTGSGKPGRPLRHWMMKVSKSSGILSTVMWGAEKGTSPLWSSPPNSKP